MIKIIKSPAICLTSTIVILRNPMDYQHSWETRICGYTYDYGVVQAIALGFFLWELQIALQHFAVFG